jgi:hypothetical protein
LKCPRLAGLLEPTIASALDDESSSDGGGDVVAVVAELSDAFPLLCDDVLSEPEL